MVGIRCVGVGVVGRQSEDSFVCLRAKPDNGLASEISYETRRRAEIREELERTQRPVRGTCKNESAFMITVWEFRSDTPLRESQSHSCTEMPEEFQNLLPSYA